MPKRRVSHRKEFAHAGKGLGVCSECDYQSNSEAAFKLHMKFVHKKKALPSTFSCAVCSEVFETQKAMNKHSMLHNPRM